MALIYTNGGGEGIFDVLGRFFRAAEQVNASRLTDVPTTLAALRAQVKLVAPSLSIDGSVATLPAAETNWKESAGSILRELVAAASLYLRAEVLKDAVQATDTLVAALLYLIRAMEADGAFVDPNVVGLSLAAGAGNSTNDLAILYTEKRGDGKVAQHTYAEAIAVSLTASSSAGVTVQFTGKESVALTSERWPVGSGISKQLAAADPAANLLANGDFEDAAITNIPDGWVLLDGLPGTAYVLTLPEVQTIAIAADPTAGGYYLKYTDAAAVVHLTTRLAFDASASAVQTALRLLPGLSAVTVTGTGTTPNFTHTVTFVDVPGDVAALAYESQLDTGTITVNTITAGDANTYRGKSMKVVGSGAANRRILKVLPTLTADTVYFVCLRHKKTNTPAAGTVRVAVLDGFGGSIALDSAGGSNSVTYDLTAGTVTTSYTAGWLAIRVKPSQAQPLYLEIDVRDLSAGTTYCLDEVVLVAGSELYAGGPFAAGVRGKAVPVLADVWTLTATNNRAGEFQTYFNSFFETASRGLLLPTSGSDLIPDSLIA